MFGGVAGLLTHKRRLFSSFFPELDAIGHVASLQCFRACLNNRQRSHFCSFVGSPFMFLMLSATYLSPRWGLGTRGFGVSTHLQDLYRTHYSFV